MKLIKPSFSFIHQLFITDFIDEDTTAEKVQNNLIDNLMKHIEVVGRTCYKSEDKITEDSYLRFIDILKKGQHYAMFEHGTVYLTVPKKDLGEEINKQSVLLLNNKYSKYTEDSEKLYITTNFRVIVENDLFPIMEYITYPTKHLRRITVKFILSRSTANEFVRHRVFSFAQESTRYCNYSKDKFGNELTFIEPCWLKDYNYEGNTYNQLFIYSLKFAEAHYLDLLKKWDDKIPDKRYKTGFRNNPWTPQQARAVLPNSLKTELVVTGFVSDWNHFFDLRARGTTGAPHPEAKELAEPLMKEFIKMKFINN